MRNWVMAAAVLVGGCKSSEIIDALIVKVEVDVRFECGGGSCSGMPALPPLTVAVTYQGVRTGQSAPPGPRQDASIRFIGACEARGATFVTYHSVRHQLDGALEEGPAGFGALVSDLVVISQDAPTAPREIPIRADLYTFDPSGLVMNLQAPNWSDGGVSEYSVDFTTQLADGGSEPARAVETHTLTSAVEPVELQYRELCARSAY